MESLLPNPVELGLPSKFSCWRPGQESAILRALDSPKRFVVLAMPVGAGKSAVYLGAALLAGIRTAFLTSTKGLQTQLNSDFAPSGLVDIRGQNNYICNFDPEEKDKPACDEGPCHAGIKCERQKEGGCDYFDAAAIARRSPLVVTNYSYWMHALDTGDGLGNFGMLVLDEAHDSVDSLSDYLAVELHAAEIEGLLGEHDIPEHAKMGEWIGDARRWFQVCAGRRDRLSALVKNDMSEDRKRDMREIRALKRLEKKVERLASAKGEWLFEAMRVGPLRGRMVRFDPVWPADYAESCLFNSISKVVLTSATIRPKTMGLLGVKPQDVDFVEYPSSFPLRNRPVYQVPTVRMDKNAGPEHMRAWLSKIDSIIRTRLGTKGLIHTVSYSRAQYLLRNSEYREHMITHETRTAQRVIDEFKRMEPPAILVSPSISTGYDFADSSARWQIIAKVPFPDGRNRVLAARCGRDKEYALYLTMQQLVQSTGRIVRSERDWGETLITDDNFNWFLGNNKHLAPKWFLDAVKRVSTIPSPLNLTQEDV